MNAKEEMEISPPTLGKSKVSVFERELPGNKLQVTTVVVSWKGPVSVSTVVVDQ
jgi:hypothetical protein